MPFLTFPLALLALAALPTLAAIYWLRNRYRRQVVSSLSLWVHATVAREGGRRIEKLQTPLLFLLELLALALLAFAATGPRMIATSAHVPLVVVLDDSYSMLAGDQMSARSLALQRLERELERGRYKTRFVLAGPRPRLLGDATTRVTDALRQLEGWECASPSADLETALGLAAEVGGKSARMLVVTDRPSPGEVPPGSLQWWALGRPRANTAFVGAARSSDPRETRVLLEVANLDPRPVDTRLVVEQLAEHGRGTPLSDRSLSLGGGEVRQVFFDVPATVGVIRATLAEDHLPIDNTVTLLPTPPRGVNIRLDVADEDLARLMRQTLEAMSGVTLVTAGPDLLVTDSAEPFVGTPRTWVLRLVADKDAVPYLGPFVIDRFHPLGEGVTLDGVIWAAARPEGESASTLPGRPVVTAGNVVLLADEQRVENSHEVRLRIRPDLSTLPRSPNWPILIWNLLQWRRGYLPGVEQPNIRTGDEARVTLVDQTRTLNLIGPDGATRELPPDTSDRLTIPVSLPGVYRVRADGAEHRFAANVLHRGESDLSDLKTGNWGDWTGSPVFQWEHRSIAWVFTLVAAAVLTLHMFLIARMSGKGMRL